MTKYEKYEGVKDPKGMLDQLDKLEELARERDAKLRQLRFQLEQQMVVEAGGHRVEEVHYFSTNYGDVEEFLAHAKVTCPDWWVLRVPHKTRVYLQSAMPHSVWKLEQLCEKAGITVLTRAHLVLGGTIKLPYPIIRIAPQEVA
jgi:hypothetical protein